MYNCPHGHHASPDIVSDRSDPQSWPDDCHPCMKHNVLFPFHDWTLPGVFLRISPCHDTRVSLCSTRISNCCIGGQILSVLPIIESTRDCRKTGTWVTLTYSIHVGQDANAAQRICGQDKKAPREPRKANFHRFDLATRSSSSFFCK
jgi:hypothetical protein